MFIKFGALIVDSINVKRIVFSQGNEVTIVESEGDTMSGECTREEYEKGCKELIEWDKKIMNANLEDRFEEYKDYFLGGGFMDGNEWLLADKLAASIGDKLDDDDDNVNIRCKAIALALERELTNSPFTRSE